MFENIMNFFKNMGKKNKEELTSKETAKERLQLVLMQDRASVSADFLDMMRQEIIEVIKKYIDVEESDIDVRLTNKVNEDGTTGSPALYANIPISGIKQELVAKKANQSKEENSTEETNKAETEVTLTEKETENESDKADKNENAEVKEDITEATTEESNIKVDEKAKNEDEKSNQTSQKEKETENNIEENNIEVTPEDDKKAAD